MNPRPLRTSPAVLLLALGGILRPGELEAQGALPALGGAAAGLVSGGLVSVGIVTVRARQGHYLDSMEEALGWQSAPVLLGAAGGALLGSTDRGRLGGATTGALVGWLAGGAAGYLLGRSRWEPPEGPWAGLAIGGAAGLVAGAATGFLLAGGDDPADPGSPGSTRRAVPPPLSLSFGFRF